MKKKRRKNLKEKNKTDSVINVQLLPPRLTSVLFHINEKQRSYSHGRFAGMFRQNKIAPIFKIDPTGLDKKKARSLDNFYRYVIFYVKLSFYHPKLPFVALKYLDTF